MYGNPKGGATVSQWGEMGKMEPFFFGALGKKVTLFLFSSCCSKEESPSGVSRAFCLERGQIVFILWIGYILILIQFFYFS